MTSKKVYFVLLGTAGLTVLLIIGAALASDTLLQKQSKKLVDLKLENQVIEMQKVSLAQAKKDIEKYAELESIAKQIVPQDKDQARAVREIVALGSQAGIKIASVTFPSSNLGQAVAPKPTPAPAAGSDTTATPPAVKPAPPLTQAKPVTGIDGLFELDITIVSDTSSPATYARLIDFLERLEQNRRTAQVGEILIQPDGENRESLNFTLTLTVYIKP